MQLYSNPPTRMKSKLCLQIIPPNIQSQITGVWRVLKAHDLVTLEYTNLERESAIIPLKRWAEIRDNFFAIVSEVQNQRKGGGAK